MQEDVDWTLLGNYLFGECTEEEAARVQEWIERDPKHRMLLGHLRKILRLTEDSPPAEEFDAQALWERIDQETEGEPERESSSAERSGPRRSRPSRRASRRRSRETSLRKAVWTGVITALVAITAALWLFGPLNSGLQNSSAPSPETFVTQKGQRTSVRLTDGSQVHLNVDSRLTVSQSFGEDNRVVRLKGEAFFEVREDSTRPFIVHSGGAITRVFGTAFDVGAYPEDDEIKVAVAEGRVSVQTEMSPDAQGGGEKQERGNVMLTKNEVSVIPGNGEQIIRREQDLSGHLAWVEGQLEFEDAPFEEVVRKLERWYDLQVELHDGISPPPGHLNARFDGDRPLHDVLRVIGAAFGLDPSRDGNTVTFTAAH